MILTDKAIRSSKPRDSVYRLREVGGGVKGFGITIAPAGSKTFFLGYTAPGSGKRTQINLGRYPATSLKDARQRAYEAREALSRGIEASCTDGGWCIRSHLTILYCIINGEI